MPPTPDFSIHRLGPATVPSPLQREYGEASRFFVADDERTLFDTRGRGLDHAVLPGEIDAVNLEVAGPRAKLFFQPERVRAAIVTCGGLCPGINHVIRGLTRELFVQYRVKEVLGIRYGFAGLVSGGHEPVQLTLQVVDRIHEAGGTILGSSRGPQTAGAMADFLQARGIDMLFSIGGDGTSRGALEIARELHRRQAPIAVIGIPKTIDNDLSCVDKTFGFETAFTIADQALRAAHAEALGAINGIGLVKLMGRHSGYITTHASLANGDVNFVLIPEVPFELDGPTGLLALLQRRLEKRGHAVIAVAEGAGQELMKDEVERLGYDASGNKRLADIAGHLKKQIEAHFKRADVPVNVRMIDPSYMIRSAPATPNDAVFCLQLAQNAVHAAMSGRTEMIVGTWKRTFTHVPMEAVVAAQHGVDPNGPIWLSLLQAIEQPQRMGGPPA
jgi:6-phosphofructokinase 1